MCGILGMIGQGITLNDREWLRDFFLLSQIRGIDSVGIMTAEYDNQTHIETRMSYKSAISASEFVKSPEAKPFFTNTKADLFLGHVRWATVGNINSQNAHPFETENLVAAHNGTLIKSEYHKDKDKTDSEMMFIDMEKRGVKEVLEGLSITDAYAISVYEKNKGILHLSRNIERPLAFAVHRTRSVIYWGSDYDYLKLSLDKKDIVGVDFYRVEVNQIYTFDVTKIKPGVVSWTKEAVTRKPFFLESMDYGDFNPPHFLTHGARMYDTTPWLTEGDLEDLTDLPPRESSQTTSGKKPKSFVKKKNGENATSLRCSLCEDEIPTDELGQSEQYLIGVRLYHACKKCCKAVLAVNGDVEHAVYSANGYPHPYDKTDKRSYN